MFLFGGDARHTSAFCCEVPMDRVLLALEIIYLKTIKQHRCYHYGISLVPSTNVQKAS